jgi:signal transduction histidine kinase
MRLGGLLETVLLAFALRDRYNLLRAEKEAAQRQVADELRRLDRLKDEILANTSHELRTPLQGIIGLSESMLDGAAGALSQGVRRNLSMMVSSGQRLGRLVDDILDFSRLKTRELRLVMKAVDLRVAIDVVVTLMQPLIRGRPIQVVNDVGAATPPVLADEATILSVASCSAARPATFPGLCELCLRSQFLRARKELIFLAGWSLGATRNAWSSALGTTHVRPLRGARWKTCKTCLYLTATRSRWSISAKFA